MRRDPGLIPLSHQHQHALALCVLIDRSPADVGEQARMIVDQFDAEMRLHFELEERVLFPAAATLASTRDLVDELIAEHRRMAALLTPYVIRTTEPSSRSSLVCFANMSAKKKAYSLKRCNDCFHATSWTV